MKKRQWKALVFRLVALIASLFFIAAPARADSADLPFALDFTSTGFIAGSMVRGQVFLKLEGRLNEVQSVVFEIDGRPAAEVSAPPFTYSFQTKDHPDGIHEMGALVRLKDGQTLSVGPLRAKFLTRAEERQLSRRILTPLALTVFLMVVLGTAYRISVVLRGRVAGAIPAGTERDYRRAGGAVCPRCDRPTRLGRWRLRIRAHRLDRCENCARIGWFFPLDLASLRAAERAELEAPDEARSRAARQRRFEELLERSRYLS